MLRTAVQSRCDSALNKAAGSGRGDLRTRASSCSMGAGRARNRTSGARSCAGNLATVTGASDSGGSRTRRRLVPPNAAGRGSPVRGLERSKASAAAVAGPGGEVLQRRSERSPARCAPARSTAMASSTTPTIRAQHGSEAATRTDGDGHRDVSNRAPPADRRVAGDRRRDARDTRPGPRTDLERALSAPGASRPAVINAQGRPRRPQAGVIVAQAWSCGAAPCTARENGGGFVPRAQRRSPGQGVSGTSA